MIKFDKLKIIVPIETLEVWNWDSETFKGEDLGLPYHLYIKVNRVRNEVTIEFSGKILLDDYPQLINLNNIRNCFEQINNLDVCHFDIELLIEQSHVVMADFTKDVLVSDLDCVENLNDIKAVAKLSINNYRRWVYQDYPHNGVEIRNIVRDRRYQRRLIIYDKSHELGLTQNRAFISSLQDPQGVIDYFRGRVRFELNATSKRQICNWLSITDNRLLSVLSSDANPLESVMREMFRPINAVDNIRITLREQDRIGLLKSLDWDLAGVEAHVRQHTNRSITEAMRPYRDLYSMHYNLSGNIDICDFVV